MHYGMEPSHEWCVLVREEVTLDYEEEIRREDELLLISGPPV